MSHWTPFYEGDYLRDTRGLTQNQHGAYILLLTHYWSTGKALPLDMEELYRIGSAHTDEEKESICFILARFFKRKKEGFFNKKSEEIIKRKNEKRSKLSENGRKGGKANAKAIASDLLEQLPKHNQNQNITKPEGLGQSPNHPVWGDALQMLMEQGEKESSARSFLGRVVKQHGEGAVNDAISACVVNQPVNVKAYLISCLNAKGPKPSGRPSGSQIPGNQISKQKWTEGSGLL